MVPAAPVILFYNGVTFDAAVVLSIGGQPHYDSSGRVVNYVRYTLRVLATIAQANQAVGATTDATLAQLRVNLTQPAGELHVEFSGFGPVVVNVPPGGPTVGAAGIAKDLAFGPKPAVLAWKPQGLYAAEVEWEVVFCIPECPMGTTTTYQFGIMEWCFSMTYEIDLHGYTKRTYKGHIIIPQTRATVSTRTLSDHADRLRDTFNPVLLIGFRRIVGPIELSEDKCRIDWSIVDIEVGPNYPPPGVIVASMEQGVRSVNLGSFFGGLWINTLAATYEVSREVQPAVTLAYFFAVLRDRLAQATTPLSKKGGKTQLQKYFLLTFAAYHPNIYGYPEARFSASWRILSNLKDIVKTSGLWRPIPNSDWRQWATSLVGSAFNIRGNAKLAFDPASEALIDLCQQNPQTPSPGPSYSYLLPLPTGDDPTDDPPTNDVPEEETSWIYYESRIRIEKIDNVIPLKPLPPPDLQGGTIPATPPGGGPPSPGGGGGIPTLEGGTILSNPPSQLQGGSAFGPSTPPGPGDSASIPVSAITDEPPTPPGSPPTVIVQERAPPTYYAYLTGRAVRAGYAITPPALVSVGGCAVVPANQRGNGFEHFDLGDVFGVNVYGATWNFRYLVVGQPAGDVSILETPFDE